MTDHSVAVVLAGGRSSRFGSDKALAALPSGELLLERAVRMVRPLVDRVILSRTEAVSASLADVELIPDPVPGQGPVAALHHVFGAVAASRFLVLPCDLPRLERAILRTLLEHIPDAPVAYAISPCGPHPLVAAWSRDAALQLTRQVVTPSARQALAELGARAVSLEDDKPFLNVNRPDDLARVRGSIEVTL